MRQLADWGADVVKIEPPTRADSLGGQRHGPDFQNLHRNKRAMTLNLKHDEGRELFLRMVAGADVVVENMRPGVKHRLGVDYEACAAVNPRIVYGSISGFGQDGPYGDRAGVDQIAQGLGGLMSVTGLPGQGPVRAGVPIADLSAGLYLALGVMMAITERDRPGGSGVGQWVHTSLLEAQVAMLDFQAARWTIDGDVPEQSGNHHPTLTPMGTFPSADGQVNIAASGGRMWRDFCHLIGAEHLLDDPDYATPELRSSNRKQLNDAVADRLVEKPTSHWVGILNEAGIPCGPVLGIDQLFADPQVEHLDLTRSVTHQSLGPLDIIRNATNLERTPSEVSSPSPEHGQHTDEILAALGIDDDARDRLRHDGVI